MNVYAQELTILKTAKTIAKSVITSSLFKAAMFGEDANWGEEYYVL